ncbi:MAG: SDR family oxidoreductase [Devosia sp.]|nr:SDR family oxidoreductase [Devosia sp.]
MAMNGVLVVTGGSRGIGAAVSLLAAERGYAVVVNYAGNVEAAEAVVSRIHKAGGEAIAVRGDVSQPEDVEHIFAAADRMGPLVGLVNNAGVVPPRPMRVDETDAAELKRIFEINVTGNFLCAAAAIRRMSTKRGGRGGSIVNLSSGASKLGGAGAMVVYGASKGAIDSFTVGLALEVAGEGIRVNAVRPGIIDTDMHASGGDAGRVARIVPTLPMLRAGTAREVAEAVLWLLSDAASYTTGGVIPVSGGRAILP